MRALLLCLAVAAAATACTRRNPDQCPGTMPAGCVAGEVCTFDEARGCRVCQCEPLDNQPGTYDPDDRSQPPDTRRPDSY
ncbi:MAG: hypothetical protein R2939_00325 [Kofleriaceae bacterium]